MNYEKRRSISSGSVFTDKNLKSLIKKGKGIIYIWSPRFVYSKKHLKETFDTATSLKIEFTAITTGHDLTKTAWNSLNNNKRQISSLPNINIYKKNASLDLKMRKVELHSPTIVLYKNGKILNEYIIGVHNKKSMKKEINKHLL